MSETLAPKPEVVHLPTLFRRIKNGTIRVPAFQREFVWKEQQILALLGSVFQGYPIGSILLWRVDQELLRVQSSEITAFPDLPLSFPLSFVLDGMQRLSTLYGVCNYDGKFDSIDKFNVIFDLKLLEFVHYDPDDKPELYVPLAALFSPKRLMEIQIALIEHADSNLILEKIVDLHAKFQEYLVPTVTIENQDVNRVVSIFERVNSTGTRLSSVDFMRAVTWSDEFDLSSHIRNIQSRMVDLNYKVDDDTIVKMLGIVNGLDPLPDILLQLRKLSARKLSESVDKVSEGLISVVSFIEQSFSIFGSDYVPYEGQILVLFKALCIERKLSREQSSTLRKWFWTTGFNEALRGKPDNFVARTINAVETSLLDGKGGLNKRLQVTPFEFRGRRFIRSKALSATMAAMFARNQARSIVTGEVIPPADYMTIWNPKQFLNVIPSGYLKMVSADEISSGRLLCNIMIASREDINFFGSSEPIDYLVSQSRLSNFLEVLESQFMSFDAIEALRESDSDAFLDERSRALYQGAAMLSEDN